MIYMNNAATGFPKFPNTMRAITNALEGGWLSSNRETGEGANDVASQIFELRNKLSNLLHAKKPHEIVFTASDTIALNLIMQGIDWRSDGVLIIDSKCHNAISRPAMHLAKTLGVTVVSVDDLHELHIVLRAYEGRVQAAVFSHGSNVTGDVIEAEDIGNALAEYKVPYILDVAQTIGLYPIDVEKLKVSAVAFAGHKGLNGLQGTGGFYVRKGFHLKPLLFGGTGTDSMSLNPEIVYPDSFEVGTPATHDLIGLSAALAEIETSLGGYEIYRKAINSVAQYTYDELSRLNNVTVYGNPKKELPVVSFNVSGFTCKEVGSILASKGIICRTGVHCASMAMYKLGDAMEKFGGTVRVSFGWGNTTEDVDYLVEVLKNTCGC